MSQTLESFMENLVASGLMTRDEVREFLAQLGAKSPPAEEFAKRLVASGRLTKYQAGVIYRGRPGGLLLDQYRVLEPIGRGGMGAVFKAIHIPLQREVAIKVLAAELGRSREAIQRFQREIVAAAGLNHPNVVRAFSACEHNGVHFLVMEYVDGCDLAKQVKEKGPLGIAQAIDFITQAARGLEYAHAKGTIHRDIKPHNLLVRKDNVVKVADMGLARVKPKEKGEKSFTAAGDVFGTVDFMAPEQADDARTADERSDIYSLGCTLHYLLIGRPPYEGDSYVARLLAHIERPIPSLRQLRSGVPQRLDEIFRRCVAKEPSERFGSMTELIAALETVPAVDGSDDDPVVFDLLSDDMLGIDSAFDSQSSDSAPGRLMSGQATARDANRILGMPFRTAVAVGGGIAMLMMLLLLLIVLDWGRSDNERIALQATESPTDALSYPSGNGQASGSSGPTAAESASGGTPSNPTRFGTTSGIGESESSAPNTLVEFAGEIHGTKWSDLNGDGRRDKDEPGLPGWSIYVDSNNNGRFDSGEPSATTDANGDYSFTRLAPGSYVIRQSAGFDSIPTSPPFEIPPTTRMEAGSSQLASEIDRRFFPHGLPTSDRWSVFGNHPDQVDSRFGSSPYAQVFLRDNQTGAITLVSCNVADEMGNYYSAANSVTEDGCLVTFSSEASNLVSGDSTNSLDVFLKDMRTKAIHRFQALDGNGVPYGSVRDARVTPDGRYLVFNAAGTFLAENSPWYSVYWIDRQDGRPVRVNVAADGTPDNGEARAGLAISPDGRYVAFDSSGTNLLPEKTEDVPGVFVWDRQSAKLRLASCDNKGRSATVPCFAPSVSPDGRYVAFTCEGPGFFSAPVRGLRNVYLKDMLTGSLECVSVSDDWQQGNSSSYLATMSDEGKTVSFWSTANNLVPEDTQKKWALFVRDLGTPGKHELVLRDGEARRQVDFGDRPIVRETEPTPSELTLVRLPAVAAASGSAPAGNALVRLTSAVEASAASPADDLLARPINLDTGPQPLRDIQDRLSQASEGTIHWNQHALAEEGWEPSSQIDWETVGTIQDALDALAEKHHFCWFRVRDMILVTTLKDAENWMESRVYRSNFAASFVQGILRNNVAPRSWQWVGGPASFAECSWRVNVWGEMTPRIEEHNLLVVWQTGDNLREIDRQEKFLRQIEVDNQRLGGFPNVPGARRVLEQLQLPMDFDVAERPLVEVLNAVARQAGVEILAEETSLAKTEGELMISVSLKAKRICAASVLDMLLRPRGWAWTVTEGKVCVLTQAASKSHLVEVVYPVAEYLQATGGDFDGLRSALAEGCFPKRTWEDDGGTAYMKVDVRQRALRVTAPFHVHQEVRKILCAIQIAVAETPPPPQPQLPPLPPPKVLRIEPVPKTR